MKDLAIEVDSLLERREKAAKELEFCDRQISIIKNKLMIGGQTIEKKVGIKSSIVDYVRDGRKHSLSDICKATGASIAYVHKIVKELCKHGALTKVSRGTYQKLNTELSISINKF